MFAGSHKFLMFSQSLSNRCDRNLVEVAVVDKMDGTRSPMSRNERSQGRLPIEEIARATGFGDREPMRRSFIRSLGQTLHTIRNASHPLASF